MSGIRNFIATKADILFTSNTVLADVLSSPIAAGETQYVRFEVFCQIGAAGGIKFLLNSPQNNSNWSSYRIYRNATDIAAMGNDIVGNATGNALANADTYVLCIEASITAPVAGNVTLQMAQNSSNATSLDIFTGAALDVVKY